MLVQATHEEHQTLPASSLNPFPGCTPFLDIAARSLAESKESDVGGPLRPVQNVPAVGSQSEQNLRTAVTRHCENSKAQYYPIEETLIVNHLLSKICIIARSILGVTRQQDYKCRNDFSARNNTKNAPPQARLYSRQRHRQRT
jgi:hypothetical protein